MNMSPEKLSFIRGSTAKQGIPSSTKEPEAAVNTVELKSEAPVQEERPSCDSPPLSDSGGDRIMVPDGGLNDERFGRGRVAAYATV